MQRFVLFVSLLCLGVLVQSQNVGGTSGPCSAFAIPPPYTKPLTLFGATPGASSISSSSCDAASTGPTIWYTITPTEGATVNITTCNPGTNFDTVISVYAGSCNSLRCLTYSDDASCTHSNLTSTSTVSFLPSANTIYYIGVGGYSTNQGSFQLTISQANSTTSSSGCSAATNVTGPYSPEITVFGSNVNASTSFSNSQCGLSTGQHTVFYHISPIVGIPMTISTCNPATNFDTVIAVFNGTNCNNLGCFTHNDDNCTDFSGFASEIAFTPTSTSYFVTVSGYNSAQGSFEISFSQTGGGSNQCANALVVYSGNIYYGSTIGAPAVVSEPCGVLSNHPTVWYRLNLNSFSTVTITTCSSATDFDTYVVVLSGQCSSLSCVAYNDDYTCSEGSSNTSRVSFTPNQSTYYILVSGYGLNSGNYELTISQ